MAKHSVCNIDAVRRLAWGLAFLILAGFWSSAAVAAPSDGAAPDAGLAPARGLQVLAKLGPPPAPAADREMQMAQADDSAGQEPEKVGKPPEEELRLDLPGAVNVGGVLTPGGMLVVEPSFTYSHSGVNRFTFRGTKIVETVLIGIVEAEESKRDFYEGALTFRYGVTDRLEVEVRVPGVYRDDNLKTTANVGGNDVTTTRGLSNFGLGDIELAAHYQLNRGGDGWPYFIANLRGKLATGKGPFDVDRDSSGIEQDLPTGSGFYSVEPSLTVIYPSDPVVLFASVGYQWNIERDIDKQIGSSQIGTVDPGDTIRFGFGFSFAVNENMSFSISYAQDLIGDTETELDGFQVQDSDLTVGNVTIGLSHRINDWMSVDLGTTFGVTGDATDVTLGLRVPMRFQLF